MPSCKFKIKDLLALKGALLIHSEEYTYASLLDSNNYDKNVNSSYEYIAGFGAKSIIVSSNWEELKSESQNNKWLFGYLSYDLKNSIESLNSKNDDGLEFPDLCFFEPEYLVRIVDGFCEIDGANPQQFFNNLPLYNVTSDNVLNVNLNSKISKEKYIEQVIQLKNHIQFGDIFEVNFCQEFFAEKVELKDPIQAYFKLNQLTKAPFSCYSSLGNFEIFSGSPERYIKKEGLKLTSQPIKGTAKRGQSEEEDLRLKEQLLADPKERAENVMIVDLVRNDLSKIATKNSVKVDELFGIYSFETVHQMISTISCEVEETTSFTGILKATFPMGSMTGAPKYSAMKLIEKHENFKRGIYSGAIGYIAPNGDFDFNVVIRTLIYNRETKYLSCPVGGAITIQSSPEAEYEECNIKVQSILKGMNA